MELIPLSFYAGSLFLLLTAVVPVLLRTPKNKDIAGSFYGRILWRFYGIAFLLLVVYLILGKKWWGILLLAGLGVNVIISMWLKGLKGRLGSIEKLNYNSPERTRFRRISYLSTLTLLTNLLISTIILFKEVE